MKQRLDRIKKNKAIEKQLLAISKQGTSPVDFDSKYKNILFCPLNASSINTIREGFMGMCFRLRGVKSSYVYLESKLPASEFYTDRPGRFLYHKKVDKNISFIEKLGFDIHRISKYKVDSDFPKIQDYSKEVDDLEYKGIKIGDLVMASSIRALLCNGPEWDNPVFISILEKNIETAVILVDAYQQMLDDVKPDKVVMTHGMYISWGVIFRICQSMDIPVDVYNSSYRKNSLRFYHNAPAAPFPPALWPEYENVDLTSRELEILDNYMEGRETQRDDNISLFDEKTEIPDHVRQFVESHKEKKIFALFTNISWDAYAFSQGDKFDNMLEWLRETVAFFNERDDAALIVKAHPAEIYHKTPEKYRVRTFVDTLEKNDNILLIREDESVKPFWLYDKIDVGLIHISTVAIEMCMRKIPVLTSGAEGHYSNKGFTIDPVSIPDYFDKLTELIEGRSTFEPDIDSAKRYLFYRFFREAIEFKPIELENLSTVKGLTVNSIDDLLPGNNKTIDIVCDGILNDAKFVIDYE